LSPNKPDQVPFLKLPVQAQPSASAQPSYKVVSGRTSKKRAEALDATTPKYRPPPGPSPMSQKNGTNAGNSFSSPSPTRTPGAAPLPSGTPPSQVSRSFLFRPSRSIFLSYGAKFPFFRPLFCSNYALYIHIYILSHAHVLFNDTTGSPSRALRLAKWYWYHHPFLTGSCHRCCCHNSGTGCVAIASAAAHGPPATVRHARKSDAARDRRRSRRSGSSALRLSAAPAGDSWQPGGGWAVHYWHRRWGCPQHKWRPQHWDEQPTDNVGCCSYACILRERILNGQGDQGREA
jgi:hypothetical protein